MWQVQWPHEGSRLARKSRRSSLRRWKSHSEWRLGTWQRNLGELCNCLQLPEKRGGMPALSHRFSSSKKLNWGGSGERDQSLDLPDHHQCYSFCHQSRSSPHLQVTPGTAHWQPCSSWMGSRTAWPHHCAPGGRKSVHIQVYTWAMRELYTWSQPLRETVRSPTGSHRASCNLGLRSTRAPGDLCVALSVTSQTCGRWRKLSLLHNSHVPLIVSTVWRGNQLPEQKIVGLCMEATQHTYQ